MSDLYEKPVLLKTWEELPARPDVVLLPEGSRLLVCAFTSSDEQIMVMVAKGRFKGVSDALVNLLYKCISDSIEVDRKG